ncbi:MAG: TonB family protein [Sphaerochaeta sp.]
MSTFRITGMTLLVIAAAFAALFIPLKTPMAVEQTKPATAASINLVDTLPSLPKTQEAADTETNGLSAYDSPPIAKRSLLPPPKEGILPREVPSDHLTEGATESDSFPASEPQQEDPVADTRAKAISDSVDLPVRQDSSLTESSQASVAASSLSTAPQPSLVQGYHETTSVDQGPSFDRGVLASRIKYPSLAKRQGREGLVMLRLFISSTGKVERIEVEEDPGYGLAEAAVRAFTGLQGEPAILGGKAVPVTLRYPVRFSLQ